MRSAWQAVLLLTLPAVACAAVQVTVGPTPIQDGEARSAGDITVINERLAFALAVGSPVPYGVPRGAIIDAAPVWNGKIGRDCIVFADFIPNNWSAWPNTFQHVEILDRGPERAVVRTVRDWRNVIITTLYTLEANSDSVEIHVAMSNRGVALPALLSGLTLWPKGGYLFGIPGLDGALQGRIDGALADRVVAYDENWSVALHAPYADHIADGSKDMYLSHSLAAGETRAFDAWLQVGAAGDLKSIIAAEISRKHLAAGTVRGSVTADGGDAVETPVVVIEKQGKAYAWTLGLHGQYELSLPVGEYALYATAKNYSQSGRIQVRVTPGAASIRDFHDLQVPASIHWSVADPANGKPRDARIDIEEGQKPLVEFLGRTTFFTELDREGRVDVPIAPGRYRFSVSAGGGFLADRTRMELVVTAGQVQTANVLIARTFDPPARGWYSADLHHHADQAEAVTPPADLARSQLAAGLDLLFVSDHDSTANHGILQAIAHSRGLPFIPGIELSASWGHFNAYPLLLGQKLEIDTGTATVADIINEARRQGAAVVQVNHPFIPYGYFTSVRSGVAPGGFNPKFDVLEINAEEPADDVKVLRALSDFWNLRHRYYLAAGTDTHDVWHHESGAVRTFAHITGTVTAAAFAHALREGHSYVTYGPLIFPSVMFGDDLKVKRGESFSLAFDLESIAGLKRLDLVESGAVINTRSFAAGSHREHVEFTLSARQPGWFSLKVEDNQGHMAYTNPIWVDAVSSPFGTVSKARDRK